MSSYNENKNERKIVCIYIRVSTEEQVIKGLSLDAQEANLRNFCKLRNFKIYKIYKDEGISAKDLKRPAFQQMLEDLYNTELENKPNTVLVYNLTRFSRSVIDTLNTLEKFGKHDIEFVSFSENLDTTTPQGRFTMTILAGLAQLEREQTSERSKTTLRYKLTLGEPIKSPPFGYKSYRPDPNKPGEWRIDKKEARTVQQLFDDAIKGVKRSDTCTKLKITPDHYRVMLRNPNYIGWFLYKKKELFKAKHEPIIDIKVFLKLNPKFYMEGDQLKMDHSKVNKRVKVDKKAEQFVESYLSNGK